MAQSLVVFLHSSRFDRLYQAASILLAASSMGWRCHLFLFFGALDSFINGAWDEVNIADWEEKSGRLGNESLHTELKLQKALELANMPSLYDMLSSAKKEKGGLTICACSASARFLELETARIKEKVDEIVGLPTMLAISAEAKHLLYI